MSFCNVFMNFNFRLPQMNFCGCSNPFMGGWNFPPMMGFSNFGGPSVFGYCGSFGGFGGFGGFSSYYNSNPFIGFNNFTNFTPTNYFDNGFNPISMPAPEYNSSLQNNNIWSQYKPSINSNQNYTQTTPQYQSSGFSWTGFTPSNATTSTGTSSSSSSSSSSSFSNYNRSVSGSIDKSYVNLSQSQAEMRAKNDNNLERLNGGSGWSVSMASFRTDIPYAKKGTSAILTKVAQMIGENLVITSALGTGGTSGASSPHAIGGYVSHHNAENPKLDIDTRDRAHGEALAQKLRATGYFSHIGVESDHLDVQIDPSKFKEEKLSVVA